MPYYWFYTLTNYCVARLRHTTIFAICQGSMLLDVLHVVVELTSRRLTEYVRLYTGRTLTRLLLGSL